MRLCASLVVETPRQHPLTFPETDVTVFDHEIDRSGDEMLEVAIAHARELPSANLGNPEPHETLPGVIPRRPRLSVMPEIQYAIGLPSDDDDEAFPGHRRQHLFRHIPTCLGQAGIRHKCVVPLLGCTKPASRSLAQRICRVSDPTNLDSVFI